VYVILMK
jgi:hypothetical protein